MVTNITYWCTIRPIMDRLTDFLRRFDLRASVIHDGALVRPFAVRRAEGGGRLHVVRSGRIRLAGLGDADGEIAQPTVVFVARPANYRMIPVGKCRSDLLSAIVDFGRDDENPMILGLPPLVVVPLREVPDVDLLVSALNAEAQGRRCGYPAVLDRLVEVLVVKILRLAIEHKLMNRGVVAGLADPRLARALTAIHAAPDRTWTLASMAHAAGMSRSRFAARFAQVLGEPPVGYLKRWRIGLAKRMLRGGRPIKQVALDVGYGSSATFGRAFGQVEGITPSVWLDRSRAQ